MGKSMNIRSLFLLAVTCVGLCGCASIYRVSLPSIASQKSISSGIEAFLTAEGFSKKTRTSIDANGEEEIRTYWILRPSTTGFQFWGSGSITLRLNTHYDHLVFEFYEMNYKPKVLKEFAARFKARLEEVFPEAEIHIRRAPKIDLTRIEPNQPVETTDTAARPPRLT
jgi:hypothetical protein